MKRVPLSAAVVFAALAFGSRVGAFPTGQYWEMASSGEPPPANPANRAGAEGIWYTGSSQDYGLKCSACHIEGEGLIGVTIVPTPAWVTVGGDPGYTPNTAYTITLTMTGEHLGGAAGAGGDNDGFAAAFEDASGNRAGEYSTGNSSSTACGATWPGTAPTGDAYTYGDCHAVVFLERLNDPQNHIWDFTWTSPAAGAGDVTLFYSVVDGNTGAESSLDDDVVEGTVVLREGP